MLMQFFTNERMQTTRAKAEFIRSEAEEVDHALQKDRLKQVSLQKCMPAAR
jgi:ribosomal protein L17